MRLFTASKTRGLNSKTTALQDEINFNFSAKFCKCAKSKFIVEANGKKAISF